MGMGNAPCSGYTIPINEGTLKKLNITKEQILVLINKGLSSLVKDFKEHEDFDEALRDAGSNKLVIKIKIKKQHILNVEIFSYYEDDGGRYDDLEEGEYFLFRESELYTKKLTPLGSTLKKLKCLPDISYWTVFC